MGGWVEGAVTTHSYVYTVYTQTKVAPGGWVGGSVGGWVGGWEASNVTGRQFGGGLGTVIRYILVTHIDSYLSLYTHSLLLLVALGVCQSHQDEHQPVAESRTVEDGDDGIRL